MVVTAGGDGVAYSDQSGQHFSLTSIPIVVASTHGAGDTFVGTLAAQIASGDGPQQALIKANQVAARLVATPERDR